MPKITRSAGGGPVHLAIDSTGLKVYCGGEWMVRTHSADKRRIWVKLHLTVDKKSGEIFTHSLTPSHDGEELPGLLDTVEGPVEPVYCDGACDDGFASRKAILAPARVP